MFEGLRMERVRWIHTIRICLNLRGYEYILVSNFHFWKTPQFYIFLDGGVNMFILLKMYSADHLQLKSTKTVDCCGLAEAFCFSRQDRILKVERQNWIGRCNWVPRGASVGRATRDGCRTSGGPTVLLTGSLQGSRWVGGAEAPLDGTL